MGADDGCVRVADFRGFFHADSGANDRITNRQTKARTDVTRLVSGEREVACHEERRQRSDRTGAH